MGKSDEIAVVTGAASGMGEAAARLLAQAGWKVLLCDLAGERLQAVADRLGGPHEVLGGDISAPDYGEMLVAALRGRPIGALVHCAGLSGSMAEPARILEVNLAATMRLVETIRPRMASGACAVLFSSNGAYFFGSAKDEQINAVRTPEAVASLTPMITSSGSAYTLSKRGVKLLVERESPSFGARGARIVSISPGSIDTPMGRLEMERNPIMQDLVERAALPRSAAAEEVAAVAAFLCSPAASFITGTDILVDGGMIATAVGAARPAAPG